MNAEKDDDLMLDALFDEARTQAPDVPPALLARVLEDAYQMQPAPITAPPQAVAGNAGLLARMRGWLPAVSGLSAASIVGLWVGLAAPAAIANVTDSIGWGTTLNSVELIPSYDDFLSEG